MEAITKKIEARGNGKIEKRLLFSHIVKNKSHLG